jgi:hypothetical protein
LSKKKICIAHLLTFDKGIIMNRLPRFYILLTLVIVSQWSLNAQWVKCTKAPGNDSIYTSPAGVGLRDLAVNGSRLFMMRITGLDSIFYSDDNGSTWHVSKPPGVVIAGTTYYPSLAHVFVHNGTIFCSGTQGTSGGTLSLWRSTDNGGTWVAQSNGLTSADQGPTTQVLYGTGNTLYAGTEHAGILLSNDNGSNWQRARHGIATYTLAGLTFYVGIKGLVAIGNDLFAGLDGNISAVGYGVVHTTLGDTSWTTVSTGLPTNSVIQAMVAVGSTLYVSASSYGTFVFGVYKSTDLGASWTKVSTGLPYPGTLKSLYATGNTIFGFSGVGLYQLNSGDTTWTAVNTTGLPSTYAIEQYAVVGTTMFMTGLDMSVSLKTTTEVWKRALSQVTEVREVSSNVPQAFSLEQNYPNPFNPTTNFGFRIANAALVTLKIYDVLGREVTTIVDKELQTGTYQASWDASTHASGVYYYRLQARPINGEQTGSFTQTNKLILQK